MAALLLALAQSDLAGADEIHVPADYPTLQAALDAAAVGDTVTVAPGIYSGPGNTNLEPRKDLLLRSEGGSEVTAIDCAGDGRGFFLRGGETRATIIEGFTVRGGGLLGSENGAGIACVNGSSPTIRRCVFRDGTSEWGGGGAYVLFSAPRFEDCSFLDNVSAYGGGLACVDSPLEMDRCTVSGNVTSITSGGGGLYVVRSDMVFTACEITANTATYGGGIRSAECSPTLIDCLVSGNEASLQGGGIHFNSSGIVTLEGCTITDNHAYDGGGLRGTDAVLTRSILWGNCSEHFGDQAFITAGSLAIGCSDVDAGGVEPASALDDQGENVFEDPLFCGPRLCVDAPVLPFDYGLQTESPCLPDNSPCGLRIGAFDESCAAVGACCFVEARCEIRTSGACAEAGGTYHGDGTGCDPNPCPGACCYPDDSCTVTSEDECAMSGGDWRADRPCDPLPCPHVLRVPSEFATIQEAIDAASDRNIVLVEPGTYTGTGFRNLNPRGKSITIVSEGGSSETILDMEGYTRGFTFQSQETPECVVRGFTIRNGSVSENAGGGILVDGASPTIVDCVIEDCYAQGLVAGSGGGIAVGNGAAPIIEQCVIQRCGAFADGSPRGGGVFVSGASPLLRGCTFIANASDRGGGVYLRFAPAQIVNCQFIANEGSGAAIGTEGSADALIEGCTIAGNYGGYAAIRTDSLRVTRSIIRDNWSSCSGGTQNQVWNTGTLTLECCAVDTTGLVGSGPVVFEGENVFEDPLFCGSAPCQHPPAVTGDYRLGSASPCLPGASPCGELIGALGVGCPVSDVPPPLEELAAPTRLALRIVGPNPTAGTLLVEMDLPHRAHVQLSLYDVRGVCVASILDDDLTAGHHRFDQSSLVDELPSGVYFMQMKAGRGRISQHLVVTR
ncbi:MAG: right-handed parallel beta-helix repeat-containing protein [Candidatus Eisenbacteria bacterium]